MRLPQSACIAGLVIWSSSCYSGERDESLADCEPLVQVNQQVTRTAGLDAHKGKGLPLLRSLCGDACIEPSKLWKTVHSHRSLSLLFVYLLVCALTIALIFLSITRHSSSSKGSKLQHPEAEAWRQGLARWLWLGWATRWISQWGNTQDFDPTKLADARELPTNEPDDECAPCSKAFEGLWSEEVRRAGLEGASLVRVIGQFVTCRKVLFLGLWEAVYEGAIHLGPPLAIGHVIAFVRWLYVQRELGRDVHHSELVQPTLLTIAAFTGLPLVIAVSSTALTMINTRLGIHLGSALSSAVFLKGQRLPVGPEGELGQPGDQGWAPLPTSFSLVQLVAHDVNANVVAFPAALVRLLVMVPIFCACLSLLCKCLGWAVLFPAGVFLVNSVGVGLVGSLQGHYTMLFCNHAGKRLEFFQHLMFGIRFIKSFGGEGVMQRILERFRRAEVQALKRYYTTMCFMYFMMLQFTRLYFLASLGGYALLYGNMEPVSIISIVPLLNSVQGAFSVVLTAVPTLASTKPSCLRLEKFMKLPEAPRGPAGEAPRWVSLWPSARAQRPALRVHGSFGWQPGGAPALRDVSLTVPHGQLVAVLGPVGAGKSTLLLAVLGELHPLGGACIEVPEKIAYSSQVPHIFEGTLRDNVLQGEGPNEERYQEALRAAHLSLDLEVLPGGDEALVGSRGIQLSGGQKARVSMARAAYSMGTDVVLIDDPFGAVDMCTAHHLMDNLLQGPILAGRTRLVVCQPDAERLPRFDWVVILADGRIEVQGPPQKVMRTAEYKSLLCCSMQAMEGRERVSVPSTQATQCPAAAEKDIRRGPTKAGVREAFTLREEAFQGKTSWRTVAYFFRLGGWLSILSCIVLYLLKNVLDITADAVLARWMTHGTLHAAGLASPGTPPGAYLMRFGAWWLLSTVSWFCCWVGGQQWTIAISRGCHAAVVRSLMRAPIDRFYDKTPVGRIMNRMSNDMMHVDTKVFVRICSTIGMLWSVSVPITYVHFMMPIWFTLLSLPYYYLMVSLLRLYWRTTVPLQYLAQVCKSTVDGELAEVESSNALVRAHGKTSHRLRVFQLALCDMVSARFLGETVLKRWLNNRIFVLGGIFVTCLSLVVVWMPRTSLDVGTANLCLVLVFSIIVTIENLVHTGASAQHQIIAMNRLHEYMALPEEAAEELATDDMYTSHMVRLPRGELVALESQEILGRVQVAFRGASMDVLLQQIPYKPAFRAACGKSLAHLAPGCAELQRLNAWHRVVAVNAARTSALEIAEELCFGTSDEVSIHIQSGWLADGVKVEIQDLRSGYSDRPRDVLQGVTLTIPRRCRAGIVGTTGCGKSTLLLSILRILEPRSGRVLLEGVDTQRLGLRTLRAAIGMVPQDHVLLQGPLRYNIDPFCHYDDEQVWEALRLVQLADHVQSCEGGLNFQVTNEGANLSYGQRQLMSLARNILRRPLLLLLDEATSAIDPHTQELVQTTMQTAFPDSTMILVAHRLETVLGADLVAVLDEGRVVEAGPVQALARAEGGRFAEMLAMRHGPEAADRALGSPRGRGSWSARSGSCWSPRGTGPCWSPRGVPGPASLRPPEL